MEESNKSAEIGEEEQNHKARLSFAVSSEKDFQSSSIHIKDYSLKDEKFSKKIVYSIIGSDKFGQFSISRRFSEFLILRKLLTERWPGFYIPKVPSKQKIGNMDPTFIQKRKALLDLFLKKIHNLEYIYISKEFQAFIREPSDFKSVAKNFVTSEVKIAEDVIEFFPRFLVDPVPDNIEETYEESELSFKSAYDALVEFREHCSSCVDNFDIYESDLIAFIAEFKELGTVFTSKTLEGGNRETFFNPYLLLLDWACAEILDIESILEAIEGRRRYHLVIEGMQSKLEALHKNLAKIQSGKKSLAQIFTKKSKEDITSKTQSEMEILESQIKIVKDCYKVMTLRLSRKEIPMFKLAKLETYKHIMKIFATANIQELTLLMQQSQALDFFTESGN